MTESRDDSFHIRCGNQLLAILERALRLNGELLPVTQEQATVEDAASDHPGIGHSTDRVPPWYDDPMGALQKGRYLISHPPVVRTIFSPESAVAGALALAARNGREINLEVRAAMEADRRKSETK
jgi:hypothetical protein